MPEIKYDNLYHHIRNYGWRYCEVENEKLRVSILVDKGTDIIEFLYKPKDIDFMWRSPLEVDASNKNPVTKPLETGAFFDVYMGGWQEMLPNINLPTNYKNAGLGLHGEIMFLPWKYDVIVDSPYELKIRFFVRMNRDPFFVVKYLTLRSNSPILEFEEIIKNEGDEEFKFMWGHHPSIGKPFLDEDCIIDIPKNVYGHTYDIDFAKNSILPLDKEFKWPFISDGKKNKLDLSKVMSPKTKTAFCVYIKNLKEGWYGITNLAKGIGFGMKWDVNIFKYICIWAAYRGYHSFPFYSRTYNIALELWSAIPGNFDEVLKLNRELTLSPQEELKTKFFVKANP
ncbi:hypothetical protein ES703_105044 [subsurface metagenome]